MFMSPLELIKGLWLLLVLKSVFTRSSWSLKLKESNWSFWVVAFRSSSARAKIFGVAWTLVDSFDPSLEFIATR